MFRKTFSLRLLHCYDVKLLWWKIESYFKDRANLLRPWKPTYFIREKSASLKNFFTNNYYFHWKKSRDIAFEKEERVNELPKNLEMFGEKLLSMSIYDHVLLYVCLFHHHHLIVNQFLQITDIEILVLLSWISYPGIL